MIAFLAQAFPPAVGGMEIMAANLARAWSEAGEEVVVFADSRGLPAEEEFDKAQKFTVHRFAGPRPFRRWRKFRAVAELAEKNPGLTVFADSWKSVPPRLDAKIPVLCIAHGNDMLAARPKKDERRGRALARANVIAANSNFTADLARRVVAESVPDNAPQIRVVHPGAGRPESPAAKTAFHKRQLSKLAGKSKPLLVTVSRLEPRKGVDAVIRALPTLKAAHPDIGYLVVGEGGDQARLQTLAKDCGVAGRVFFAGHLPAAKKFSALEMADLFVMPCRRSANSVEGFGVALLEAALCGIPALAGRAGGAGDAVDEGKTGWLCEGDDDEDVCKVLTAALADEKELAKRGKAAQARAESDFQWSAAAQGHLALAKEAAGG